MTTGIQTKTIQEMELSLCKLSIGELGTIWRNAIFDGIGQCNKRMGMSTLKEFLDTQMELLRIHAVDALYNLCMPDREFAQKVDKGVFINNIFVTIRECARYGIKTITGMEWNLYKED